MERDIARADFVTPAVIRTTLLVRSMSSFSCSLANSLAHSRTFLSILLLPLRRPDALGIRVSSSPSASLCRRSFFLRLSLLVPFLSSSLSLFTIPSRRPRRGAFALSSSGVPSRRLHSSLFSRIVALPPFLVASLSLFLL